MNGFQYKGSIVRNNLRLDLYLLTNSTLLIVTEIVCFYFNGIKKHGNHFD